MTKKNKAEPENKAQLRLDQFNQSRAVPTDEQEDIPTPIKKKKEKTAIKPIAPKSGTSKK